MANRWVKVTVDPILNEAGALTGVVHIIADITPIKKSEEALRESEEKLSVILATTPAAIFLVNPKGRIIFANRKMAELFACRHDELLGTAYVDLIHPEERRIGSAKMKDLMAGRIDHVSLERRYLGADGREFWGHLSGRKLLRADGSFVGLVGIIMDITERKQAEAEIIRKTNQLRALGVRLAEVEEVERQIMARELHDQVCQSLTALGLNLTLLQSQMPREIAAPLQHRLDDALALVEQTGQCVRDVMAELRPPVLDDYGLLAALRWYGAEFSQRTGIGVEVRGQEVVPRLTRQVELALFRIAQEAMTNVSKHARASQVVLTQEDDQGALRLIIADNGVGFDATRLGQPEGRHRWGLMTMGERAMAAGGRCHIDSQPGQGTRVVVEVSR
jgi:two-component system sensor histidine kinase UhpB